VSDALMAEKKMRKALANPDTEEAHALADEILVKLLRQLGYKELCDLYERVDKWYA
jgi:ABC-type uncharacterized transport system fused permease/ATPase subunit